MIKNLNITVLPPEAELVLFLIREELKSYKFFNILSRIGYDEWHYRTNFSDVILPYCGFRKVPDDLMKFYMDLMTEHSEPLDGSKEELVKAALRVYTELMVEQRKRVG